MLQNIKEEQLAEGDLSSTNDNEETIFKTEFASLLKFIFNPKNFDFIHTVLIQNNDF